MDDTRRSCRSAHKSLSLCAGPRRRAMAPRRQYIQPLSPIAVWARRLAFFSIPGASVAIIVERAGIFEIYPVLATFGASLVLAGLAVLLGFLSLAVIWFTGD